MHDAIHFAIAMPGGSELLLILLIVLVVFGHNRIPQLGDALGKGIKNFRKSFAKDESELKASQPEVEVEVRTLPEAKPDAAERLKQNDEQKVS
jgi:sec-independent protein translocase protein TatA